MASPPPSARRPRPLILLFRTPTSPPSPDPYLQIFTHGPSSLVSASSSSSAHSSFTHFDPICIPTLTEVYRTEGLKSILQQGGDGWDGVIISSKRGAEAWVQAAVEVEADSNDEASDGIDWSSTPLYTIGPTSSLLLSSSSLPAHLLPSLASTSSSSSTPVRECTSASDLIPLLLRQSSRPHSQGYLILRGDKTLGELSAALRQADREFWEVVVYETGEDPGLAHHIGLALDSIGEVQSREAGGAQGGSEEVADGAETGRGEEVWLAFFAPSSAGMALHHLRQISWLDRGLRGGDAATFRIRVAAIGETTAAFLQNQEVRVDAVADQPGPEGLWHAIQTASRHEDLA